MTDTTELNRRGAKRLGWSWIHVYDGEDWMHVIDEQGDVVREYLNGRNGPADSADVALRELWPLILERYPNATLWLDDAYTVPIAICEAFLAGGDDD